jgi:hypothetical protein
MLLSNINLDSPNFKRGQPVAQFVEALRYKPDGHGFYSRWFHLNFLLRILPAAIRLCG